MSGNDWEGGVVFEIAIALPKWGESKGDANDAADCVEVLIAELRKKGLLTERVVGLQNEFIKVHSRFCLFIVFVGLLFVCFLVMLSLPNVFCIYSFPDS